MIVLALTLMLGSVHVQAQSVDAGMAAYNRADYAEAYRIILPLAEQGNAEAQFVLGYLYDEGLGVSVNTGRAIHWYRLAAEQGYDEAQYMLGELSLHGDIVDQDYEQALYWYRLSADQGYAEAQYMLGEMYEFGDGVDVDLDQAIYWYRLAARQGHTDAVDALEDLDP